LLDTLFVLVSRSFLVGITYTMWSRQSYDRFEKVKTASSASSYDVTLCPPFALFARMYLWKQVSHKLQAS